MVGAYNYTSAPTIECITPKVSPNVNYGLKVIMMCQCRYIYCYNIPLWYMILIVREFLCMLIQWLYGNSLYFVTLFCYKLLQNTILLVFILKDIHRSKGDLFPNNSCSNNIFKF